MNQTRSPIVREARREDLPRILVLLYQLSQSSSNPDAVVLEPDERHESVLTEFNENPNFRLLVLETEGQVLGTCHLYLLPSMSRGCPRWAVVEHVVVDEPVRSRGYGETLMAEAVRLAREAGCRRVSLGSNLRRVDSHRFYERIGFKATQKGFTLMLE